jgi:hypothetical protein
MFKNKKDWVISIQTSYRWRFRDYNSQTLMGLLYSPDHKTIVAYESKCGKVI